MKVKVSELDALLADLVKEVDGVKVVELEALKAKLERMGVKVAILPNGPPDPGKR